MPDTLSGIQIVYHFRKMVWILRHSSKTGPLKHTSQNFKTRLMFNIQMLTPFEYYTPKWPVFIYSRYLGDNCIHVSYVPVKTFFYLFACFIDTYASLLSLQVDDGWYLGECHGKFGLFPANYVQINKS